MHPSATKPGLWARPPHSPPLPPLRLITHRSSDTYPAANALDDAARHSLTTPSASARSTWSNSMSHHLFSRSARSPASARAVNVGAAGSNFLQSLVAPMRSEEHTSEL